MLILRYGNPEMLFLGTLKNKIQILRFFIMNMKNLVLFFWSGLPLVLRFVKLSCIWEPWKFKVVFYIEFYLEFTFHELLSWYIFKERMLLLQFEGYFHQWLPTRRWDENHLHILKVIFVPWRCMKEIVHEMSIAGKSACKTHFLIFRVPIFKLIWLVSMLMLTLIKKVTPDSSYI